MAAPKRDGLATASGASPSRAIRRASARSWSSAAGNGAAVSIRRRCQASSARHPGQSRRCRCTRSASLSASEPAAYQGSSACMSWCSATFDGSCMFISILPNGRTTCPSSAGEHGTCASSRYLPGSPWFPRSPGRPCRGNKVSATTARCSSGKASSARPDAALQLQRSQRVLRLVPILRRRHRAALPAARRGRAEPSGPWR